MWVFDSRSKELVDALFIVLVNAAKDGESIETLEECLPLGLWWEGVKIEVVHEEPKLVWF